jgi:hypothetical protein
MTYFGHSKRMTWISSSLRDQILTKTCFDIVATATTPFF